MTKRSLNGHLGVGCILFFLCLMHTSQLKKEEAKCCVDQLQCNLVIVKRHDAKILRLNLMRSSEINSRNVETIPHPKCTQPSMNIVQETRLPPPDSSAHSISEEPNSSSSPEVRTPFTITDKGTSSATSSDRGTSPALCTEAAVKTYTNPQGDFGPLAIETDTDSEYEPSKDEECSDEESCINVRIPVSKTTNASPDLFFTKRTYDNIPHPHMWPDFGIANGKYFIPIFPLPLLNLIPKPLSMLNLILKLYLC